MIRGFALLLMIGSVSTAAFASSNENKMSERKPSNHSYVADFANDLSVVFKNKVFKGYSDYTVDQVRQGEIGEAQAFFIRLVKPFSTDSKAGICINFTGVDKISGSPHSCEAVE